MKTACRIAVTIVFLGAIAGCAHKPNPAPPPQAQAPLGPVSNMAYVPAMPPLPPPTPREVVLDTGTQVAAAPPPHPRRIPRRKPSPTKPATPPDTPAGASAAQSIEKPEQGLQTQATNTAPPDGSPIGELSSGADSSGSQGRHEIEQLINTTETGLNNIKRPFSVDEQLTATQIKNFLAKAKQSLTDNDLAAAQTLATKAKVLLDELIKK